MAMLGDKSRLASRQTQNLRIALVRYATDTVDRRSRKCIRNYDLMDSGCAKANSKDFITHYS